MAIKIYSSDNYVVIEDGLNVYEYAKGHSVYTYKDDVYTIKEITQGEYKVTTTQLDNGDILDESGAYTESSFVTFLRQNTGFKTASGGSGASWGSITGTLSSQTDLQSALDAKQDDLVSGTNIKTINGNSLLGSGDLTISGGGNSGGANTPVKLGSGRIYSNIPIGASVTNVSLSSNTMYLAPFIPAQTFTISDFKINVSVLGTGDYRILLYSHSDTNGLPDILLYESSNLSVLTTGIKTATTTQTFTAGTTYWLGVYGNSTVQFAASAVAYQNQIGVDSTLSQYTSIIRNVTFGSAPNPFGTTHTISANTFTRIGLTVA